MGRSLRDLPKKGGFIVLRRLSVGVPFEVRRPLGSEGEFRLWVAPPAGRVVLRGVSEGAMCDVRQTGDRHR